MIFRSLEESLKSEVIEFSASGFRDFTRIAASDPVMWRDIFLNNREAVLEIVQRFTEDLTALQRAIRWGEGDKIAGALYPHSGDQALDHRGQAGLNLLMLASSRRQKIHRGKQNAGGDESEMNNHPPFQRHFIERRLTDLHEAPEQRNRRYRND